MNLVLLEADEAADQGRVTLYGARARHLLGVLGVATGDQVRVGIVDGPVGVGTVSAVHETTVQLQCTFDSTPPPRPAVDLLLALPRPKVLRRLWAQLAAVGIGRIMLTNAERVERDYFGTHMLDPAFYRPLLIEGLQQARDTRLPLVSVHRRFRVLVEDDLDELVAGRARILAHPAAPEPVSRLARAHAANGVLLAVGPEGGWNSFELALLEAHGFRPAGMGPRTLRTDTACIALLTLAHEALREPLAPATEHPGTSQSQPGT